MDSGCGDENARYGGAVRRFGCGTELTMEWPVGARYSPPVTVTRHTASTRPATLCTVRDPRGTGGLFAGEGGDVDADAETGG